MRSCGRALPPPFSCTPLKPFRNLPGLFVRFGNLSTPIVLEACRCFFTPSYLPFYPDGLFLCPKYRFSFHCCLFFEQSFRVSPACRLKNSCSPGPLLQHLAIWPFMANEAALSVSLPFLYLIFIKATRRLYFPFGGPTFPKGLLGSKCVPIFLFLHNF